MDFSQIPCRQKCARNGQSEYLWGSKTLCKIHNSTGLTTDGSVGHKRACSLTHVHRSVLKQDSKSQLFFSRAHCLSEGGHRNAQSFFQAPAVLPHCGIMINYSTTSPWKIPFSLLYSLWSVWAEKIGIDQARSDQAVEPPCVDMSHSLPAARPLARLRSSRAAVRQMWCVDCILPVGWIECCMFDLRK